MAQPNLIGEGKFATPLELLPGERVLWQGGARRRAAVVLVGRLLAVVLIPMLFVVAMLGVGLIGDHKDSGKQDTEEVRRHDCPQKTPQSCAGAAAQPAAAAQASAQRPKKKATKPESPGLGVKLFLGILGLVIALTAFYSFVLVFDCWLRVRHAWYVITSERVCIRSGGWSNTLVVLDLDKVISVKAQATWLEARLGLQNIELTHASGVTFSNSAYAQLLSPNAYAIAHVPAAGPLLSDLVNHWLPRDDRRTF